MIITFVYSLAGFIGFRWSSPKMGVSLRGTQEKECISFGMWEKFFFLYWVCERSTCIELIFGNNLPNKKKADSFTNFKVWSFKSTTVDVPSYLWKKRWIGVEQHIVYTQNLLSICSPCHLISFQIIINNQDGAEFSKDKETIYAVKLGNLYWL